MTKLTRIVAKLIRKLTRNIKLLQGSNRVNFNLTVIVKGSRFTSAIRRLSAQVW
jgi:hypothetical protein